MSTVSNMQQHIGEKYFWSKVSTAILPEKKDFLHDMPQTMDLLHFYCQGLRMREIG